MEIFIDIIDSEATISRNMLRAIMDHVNQELSSKIPVIRNKVADVVEQIIVATPTYESLTTGELAGHFGIPAMNRRERLRSIVDTIKQSIEVTFKPITLIGKRFRNGMTIGVLLKNFADILAMSEAIVYTEQNQQLPWLKWLLLSGDRILISKHEIRFSPNSGRSGMAVMISNKAEAWRVPPEHAGTLKNNWLTRAFIDNQDLFLDNIGQILQNELQ
jgi:hypothetical protein